MGRRRASIDWCPTSPPTHTTHSHRFPSPPLLSTSFAPPFSSRCFFLFLLTFRGLERKNLLIFFFRLNFSTPGSKLGMESLLLRKSVSFSFFLLLFHSCNCIGDFFCSFVYTRYSGRILKIFETFPLPFFLPLASLIVSPLCNLFRLPSHPLKSYKFIFVFSYS